MKRILAALITLVLLAGNAPHVALGDMIPLPPQAPNRKTPRPEIARHKTVSLYSVAAGAMAVALAGSLIALRRIRKKSLESEIVEDAADGVRGPNPD